MKKSLRLTLSGSLQPMFYFPYVKQQADKLKVRGFIRGLGDSKVELFVEGDSNAVQDMLDVCQTGPFNTAIRNMEQKEERFQDFKDFRIMKL